MRTDESHREQIERWAEYVRNNPDWKSKLTPFLNAQIIIANRFYRKLAETPEGMEKIRKIQMKR
jgi:hypothetical protein